MIVSPWNSKRRSSVTLSAERNVAESPGSPLRDKRIPAHRNIPRTATCHHSPHRGLDGAIPLDHWARTAGNIRLVGPATDLDTLFRYRLKRRVSKDRTVSIDGTLYEVDAALVGENVILLQDLSAPRSRPMPVLHAGRASGEATLLDACANTRVKRTRMTNRPDQAVDPAPEPPPSPLSLSQLRNRTQDSD